MGIDLVGGPVQDRRPLGVRERGPGGLRGARCGHRPCEFGRRVHGGVADGLAGGGVENSSTGGAVVLGVPLIGVPSANGRPPLD